MFLEDTQSGDLVRIGNLDDLFDPFKSDVSGRDQSGEEEQEPAVFRKDRLVFPSGEHLPRCWLDVNYRVPEARLARG